MHLSIWLLSLFTGTEQNSSSSLIAFAIPLIHLIFSKIYYYKMCLPLFILLMFIW